MAVNNLNTPGVGIQPSIVDAKGDLIAATAADAVNRLAVGTNGQVLVADSGETPGLKWAAAGSVGGLVHINTTSFSAVESQEITNCFSSTYDNYLIKLRISSISTNNSLTYFFRSAVPADLSSNNRSSFTAFYGSSIVSGAANNTAFLPGFSSANPDYMLDLNIYNPLSTTKKIISGIYFGHTSSAGGQRIIGITGSDNSDATAATGIRFLVNTGNMTGEISVFGYEKS